MILDGDSLIQTYLETEYIVFHPPISIRIGQYHPVLDDILIQKHFSTWTFLTAWNPRSCLLSKEENLKRNLLLLDHLKSFESWKGEGKGKNWSEESYLVLGMGKNFALDICKTFDQNAFVFGKVGEEAELVFCNESLPEKL